MKTLVFSLLAGAVGFAAVLAAEQDPAVNLPPAWDLYRVIMWVGDSAAQHPGRFSTFLDRLREMGVNTGMVHHDADPAPWVAAGFPFYVENLVNKGLCLKWNSTVRDWDRFVTDWARRGRPEESFIRDYSLDDPAWRDPAMREAQRLARKHAGHPPVAYDLRDELSVTISANPFDYDFSPTALAGFRRWLKEQDGDLAALNRRWETAFASWEEVRPFSTDRIKHRMVSGEAHPRGQPDWPAVQHIRFDPATARRDPARWNFSPWVDFRTYMDLSLARTLNDLRQAIRTIDPQTPVGIEGTQMPHAFGGYDLWRLAHAVDWVEPYDIGNAREIFGSFMPGRPILSTVFEKDTAPARRRLWHLLLEGDRGCIIWWSEDCFDWSRDDLALTRKARALALVLQEMNSPLARLFLRARRERDPVYIHYSQASIQVNWLLESTVDGSTWPRRFSSFEAEHNRMAKVRNAWVKALQDLGLSPQFLAAEQLAAEAGPTDTAAVIVLPQSTALSSGEISTLHRRLRSGESSNQPPLLVFADGLAGQFDEHGRLRPEPALTPMGASFQSLDVVDALGGKLTAVPRTWTNGLVSWPAQRLAKQPDPAFWRWLEDCGLRRLAPVWVDPKERVRVHRFRLGDARLLAFERNIDYQMSEDLKQAGGNEQLEQAGPVSVRLAESLPPGHLYDLRSRAYLGQIREWTFTLDPWQPSLFALLPEQLPPESLWDRLGR